MLLKAFLFSLLLLFLVCAPLFAIYKRVSRGKRSKKPLIVNLCSFFGMAGAASILLFSRSAAALGDTGALASPDALAEGMRYIAAALAVGLSGIGGGIAVSASAAAALGALSENDGIFGKALIFVGMAEGVALYGLLLAFLIMFS